MKQDLYATPRLIDAALRTLGGIDLDAASDRTGRSTVPSDHAWTAAEDGLAQPWDGRVWVFPPQGPDIALWAAKFAHEYHSGRMVAGLFYTSFDPRAPWFQRLAGSAILCFVAGHLQAIRQDGSDLPRSRMSGLLAYLGPEPDGFRAAADPLGAVLRRLP